MTPLTTVTEADETTTSSASVSAISISSGLGGTIALAELIEEESCRGMNPSKISVHTQLLPSLALVPADSLAWNPGPRLAREFRSDAFIATGYVFKDVT